ncbi:MAG: hypothetical protein JJE12_02600 [Anaerolineales bacterium]|nr:hypothetical protein [Anaerolineales bacterium]
MEQLLSTKLFIPHTRPELVPRPRLIERMNKSLHRKLTLISAPAGFGKTTLVTDWQEIATRLYISQNTVKVHIRNIYAKLSASHRAHAVARARTLGILPSTYLGRINNWSRSCAYDGQIALVYFFAVISLSHKFESPAE